jgi:hypothetical protein
LLLPAGVSLFYIEAVHSQRREQFSIFVAENLLLLQQCFLVHVISAFSSSAAFLDTTGMHNTGSVKSSCICLQPKIKFKLEIHFFQLVPFRTIAPSVVITISHSLLFLTLFRFAVRPTSLQAEWSPKDGSKWEEKNYEVELKKLEQEAEERLDAKIAEMMSKIETTGTK